MAGERNGEKGMERERNEEIKEWSERKEVNGIKCSKRSRMKKIEIK